MKIFEIVREWLLHPKELAETEEEIRERQEMNELIERVRAWEEYYFTHETPEQRKQREFFRSLFVQF